MSPLIPSLAGGLIAAGILGIFVGLRPDRVAATPKARPQPSLQPDPLAPGCCSSPASGSDSSAG